MKHIDLFSGIGGFSYAADQVWPDLEHIFCDIDPFCRAVTQKHWPGSTHYADIRELIANAERERNGGGLGNGYSSKGKIPVGKETSYARTDEIGNGGTESETWLVTGGFPCQPFSQAGRRRGTADDRYLWPAMFRVIQLTSPQWVIGENVGGFVTWNEGMVLEQVCTDLESEGYEVQPFIIPACAVNAPHRRDRVWIVANKQRPGLERGIEQGEGQRGQSGRIWINEKQNAQNTIGKRSGWRMEGRRQVLGRKGSEAKDAGPDWEENWIEVATRLCRVDDGLPARVDGPELSKSAHRRERLKSLGNAIVPQVALEIMKSMV
jgi:DNA (cytosine-5)-methyltransferase 1